jgi:hypothetical protein
MNFVKKGAMILAPVTCLVAMSLVGSSAHAAESVNPYSSSSESGAHDSRATVVKTGSLKGRHDNTANKGIQFSTTFSSSVNWAPTRASVAGSSSAYVYPAKTNTPTKLTLTTTTWATGLSIPSVSIPGGASFTVSSSTVKQSTSSSKADSVTQQFSGLQFSSAALFTVNQRTNANATWGSSSYSIEAD